MVWTDFLKKGSCANYLYNADNFAEIYLHGEHHANTYNRDAFRGSKDISIVTDIVSSHGTAPVEGGGYKEAYIREAASAIAVSYNLTGGVQPNVEISCNTTTGGATGIPPLCFGGGSYTANGTTDMSKIAISGNNFETNAQVK